MTLKTSMKSALAQLKGGLKLFQNQFTPETHQSLIFWHCQTNGYFTDFLSYKNRQPVKNFLPEALGSMFSQDGLAQEKQIVGDIKRKGYHVLQERLAPEFCDALIDVIAKTPANIRRRDSELHKSRKQSFCFEDPPQGVIYDCSFADLMQHEIFQSLVSEPLFLKVAGDYLGTIPKLDPCNAWWTVPAKDKDDSYAQDYHFDMDTVRWIKVFIYLSDVTPKNGPHSFIQGTHRTGKIPFSLRKKGYSRLTDDEVFRHFSKQDEIEFIGPKGTIIFEDTRGLHKGQPVIEGSRLILSLQFSNVIFQTSQQQSMASHHQKSSWEDVIPVSKNFRQILQECPEIFGRYFP